MSDFVRRLREWDAEHWSLVDSAAAVAAVLLISAVMAVGFNLVAGMTTRAAQPSGRIAADDVPTRR